MANLKELRKHVLIDQRKVGKYLFSTPTSVNPSAAELSGPGEKLLKIKKSLGTNC